MKYIGIDIATISGWAFFEDENLIQRGTIQLIQGMDLPQKLHYFHLELKQLLERLQPEWCFIEDVILGISGAKTLSYLARLNGVAINTAFGVLQQNVKLYGPAYWKANSFPGLSGMAKKWQIQLEAVKYLNIPIVGNFENVNYHIHNQELRIKTYREKIQKTRGVIDKLKSSSVRKKNPLSDDEKKLVKNNIKVLEIEVKELKILMKSSEKGFDKLMSKTSLDISAQSGMTDNICDACGVAICGYKDVINVNSN